MMVETLSHVKEIDYYMSLSYPIQLVYDSEDEYWIAEIPDLPGCMSGGADPNEAVENIKDAQYSWIDVCIERGHEVPTPTYEDYLEHLADGQKEVV